MTLESERISYEEKKKMEIEQMEDLVLFAKSNVEKYENRIIDAKSEIDKVKLEKRKEEEGLKSL